ncbi:restriction endonuclease subunit S [Roseovarius sp. D0-M9]|uniref:restriction endonuclease subunit S n=1 Tax=Roseovarius sp. D0-M9 TaxID=3127117 RepID=UPI003010466C
MTDIMTLASPPYWKLYRLGQLFRERKEKGSDRDFLPLSVTMGGIVPQIETAAKTDDGDNRKIVRVGDYVINSRSDRKGSGGISDREGSVSLISIVLEPRNIDPRFAHHLLRSPAFQEEFYRWGHGIVADLWTTRYADMKNIRLRVPELAIQRLIADFLDRETARIDLLIEKKQRLVALLGEERGATITTLIMGGEGTAHRAPRHSKWFPELPSDWALARVKHVTTKISDGPHISPDYVDDGIPFISARNIKVDRWSLDDAKYISSELFKELTRKSKPQVGDVLYTKGGTTGVARAVDLDFDFHIWVHVALLKLRKRICNPQFLAYALNSVPCYEQSQLATRGATNNDLGLIRIANIQIPLPPLDSQKQIVGRIDRSLSRIDKLTKTINASIDRLKEYRSALITAAVTGQVDVQTYTKSGTSDRRLDAIQEEMGA